MRATCGSSSSRPGPAGLGLQAFNAFGPTVALASGQAAVFFRAAIMSKDGDWVVRESAAACHRVLSVLESRGARYRPASPVDVHWLSGGWSSHFEFFDERRRRIRCDFVCRPRVSAATIEGLFVLALTAEADDLQQRDHRRVERITKAAARYLDACRAMRVEDLPLREAHTRLCEAAEHYLPARPLEDTDADAE